jgi:periplasmic protein TonB
MVVGYTAIFYGVAHKRAPRAKTDGPPMFKPVMSEVGARRGDALAARPPAVAAEDQSTPPARHWIFNRIDIWPSAPGWIAPLTDFTPVTDAQPDPRDGPAPVSKDGRPVRRSILRMVRWLRPSYPADWASAGVQGSVLLDLLIDPNGQPIEIKIAQGSGSQALDQSAARAANDWRFAPPRWNSQPVEVWARIEVRFVARENPAS